MNSPSCAGTLSFVMPVAMTEALNIWSDWRCEVNKDGVARFMLFLRSFTRMFRQKDLCEFIVVCPDDQCAAVRTIVAEVTRDPRYRVLAESHVAPGIGRVLKANTDGLGGWYAQQIIKLAAHAIVRTQHYFVLDSDLACIRPCCHDSFIADGRALLNVELTSDFTAVYDADFIDKEVRIKAARRRDSLEILGMKDAGVDCEAFYGETPVILSASHVAAMLEWIQRVHGKDWITLLAGRSGWTEYGLYFGYLDALGLTDTAYCRTGCNTILSLHKSVWQQSAVYRLPRSYDRAHFFASEQGYFVAIQSWIPEADWLPMRYASKLAFYRDLEEWIGSAYPQAAALL